MTRPRGDFRSNDTSPSAFLLVQVAVGMESQSGVGVWGKRLRRTLIQLLVIVLAAAFPVYGVRGIGHWLVVVDPLEHARAIVILGGHLPFRAMEAASIYRQGLAPEVWLTGGAGSAEEAALARLGLQTVREEVYNRAVLERLGVPRTSIRLLSGTVQNTLEEVQRVAREVEGVGGDRVILVTSKFHTRRVRTMWRALMGDSPHAIVRYATEDPYEPSRWWRHTGDALAVSREVFGLLNVWAGFPLQPDRR